MPSGISEERRGLRDVGVAAAVSREVVAVFAAQSRESGLRLSFFSLDPSLSQARPLDHHSRVTVGGGRRVGVRVGVGVVVWLCVGGWWWWF